MQRLARSLAAAALFAFAPPVAAGVDDSLWVELLSPALDQPVHSPLGLIEVSGRAGEGAYRALDVVIAVDLSESTLYPSGSDVDMDGTTGEVSARGPRYASGAYRPIDRWTTDPDDTIVRAELEAARRLVRRLALGEWARVGVVTFTGRGRLVTSVGDPARALEDLNALHESLDPSGTNLGSALRRALSALRRAPPRAGGPCQQIVLVLSDGQPTVPFPPVLAEAYALSAADRAAALGVRVFGFALGPEASEKAHVMRDMANATGGGFVAVERVADVVDHLPYTDFAGVDAVEIDNRTNGTPARAVRVFADGSFDGFVQLAGGENLIEITVHSSSGRELRVQRSIEFEPLAPPNAADLSALRETIRARTLEMELSQRIRRSQAVRNLKIDVTP